MAMKNRGASSAIQAYQNRLKQLYDATNNAAAQQMNAQSRAGVQSMNNAFKSVPQPSTQGGMADFSSGLSAIQKAVDEVEKARLKAEEAAAKEAAAAQKKAAKEAEKAAKEAEKEEKARLEELAAAEEAKAEAEISESGSGNKKYEAVIGKNAEEESSVYLPSLPKEEEIVSATEKLNSARTLADAQNYITALRKLVSDAKSGDIDGGYYTTSMRAAIIKADEAIQTATDNIQNQVYQQMEQRDRDANKTSAFEKLYSDMKEEDREALDLLALHEIVGDQFGHDVEPGTENKNSLSRAERNELREQLKKAGYHVQEIIDYRVNMYSAAERERSRQHLEEEMNKSAANTVLANAGSVIGSIPANIMGAGDIILQEAKRTITGSEAPINTNSPLQSFSNANNDVRAITSEKIRAALDKDAQSEGLTAGNAAAFGYQTVMSSLDSVMAAMTPGGVAMIGLGAGLDATKDAIESGASAEEAIAYGLLAGAFESFFEEKSIANFKEYFGTKALRGKTGKELAKTIAGNLAKSMTTNASEEFFTQMADDIAEALTLADKSALAKVYDSAIANGESGEKAVAMYLAKDTAMAGVGGALQGLLMGSVGSIGGGMTRAAFGEYYQAAQDVNERLKAGEITEEQASAEKAQAQKNFGIDQQDAMRIDLQAQTNALGDAIREATPDIAEEADAMAEAADPGDTVNIHVQNIMDKLSRGERLVNHDAEAFYLNGRSDVDARMKNVEALAEAIGEDAAKLKAMKNAEMREYVKALTADRFSAADNAEAFAQDTMVGSDLNAVVSKMENVAAPKAASVSAVDRAVERMAFEGISPEAESLFRENAEGKRINDYSTKFQRAYLAGYNGNALSTAGADRATAAVMQQAYKLAQRERSETARAENLAVVSAEVADDKNNRGLRFVEAPSDTSAAAMRSVEQVQKIAKNFGHDVYFVENAAFQGKLYKNAIYLNANMTGNQMLQRTLGHELTHTLEKGKQYSRLYNYVLGSESIKVWAKNQDRYTAKTVDGIASEIAKTYEKAGIAMDGERGGMGQNDPYTEIVADFCGDVLLGESDISERAIRELCGENRSLAQRIRDAIASMMELLRGTKKEDELRHVLKMFEEGLGSKSGIERFSINQNYANDVEDWYRNNRDTNRTFYLGSTGDVMQGLGARENDIYIIGDKINAILSKHQEMTINEIKSLPEVLENPILVLASANNTAKQKNNTRMALFGNLKAKDGRPVMCVLDLVPIEGKVAIDDMQKVTSAYSKDVNPIEFIKKSDVLFVSENKKRTQQLLQSIGFKVPIKWSRMGSIGNIAYKNRTVKVQGVPFNRIATEATTGTFGNNDVRLSLPSTDSNGNALTDAQREYFKDSKAVDENGNLRVVYHGTDADFTVFDKTKGRGTMDIQGMFFSPYDIDAAEYGSKVGKYYLNIKNPASEGTAYKALNQFKGENNAGVKAREYLESLGYDGVYNGYDEYIAFDSNQIKRIDNRNPTSNPDIRYSIGVGEKITKSNRELVKENQRLSEQVKLLKQEMKLSGGHVMNDAAMNRLVSRLRRQNQSAIDSTTLKGQLSNLFQYIANAEELNWDDVMDVSADIARNILDESSSTGKSLRESDDRHARLWEDLKEVTVKPKMLKSLEAAFGKRMFGKIGGIKVNVDENARGIDDLYRNTLRRMYPEYFSYGMAEEDVFERMMEVRQAINEPVIDGHDGMTYDEAAYDLAQQIWDAYLETPEHHTFADRQKAERDAIVAKYRQRMVQQRNDSREKYEARLADVRAENAQTIKELQEEIRSLKVRERELQSANNALAKSSKREAEKLRAQIDAKANKIREMRSEKNQEIADTQARYRDIIKNQRQQREMTELRNKIQKMGDDLSAKLVKPSENRHIPQPLVRVTAELCDIIAGMYGRNERVKSAITAGGGFATSYHSKLQELQRVYKSLKNDPIYDVSAEWNEEVDGMIQYLNEKSMAMGRGRAAGTLTDAQEMVQGVNGMRTRAISDLSYAELKELYNVISAIQHTISYANKALTAEYKNSLSETRNAAYKEVMSGFGKNARGKAEQFKVTEEIDYLLPHRLFRLLGNYQRGGAFAQMWDSLNGAMIDRLSLELKGNSFFSKLADKKDKENKKRLKEFSGADAERITLKTRSSDLLRTVKVDVTPAMLANMVDVWLHNQEEVDQSGFTVPELKLYYKGMVENAIAQGTVIRPTPEQMLEWSAMLDDYARGWANALTEYSEYISPKMRETQMKVVGFSNITEQDHRTLYRDTNFVKGDSNAQIRDRALEHAGFTKNRIKGASQPICVMDITDYAKRMVHDTCLFVGMTGAVRDFSRIYDGKVHTGQTDSEGSLVAQKSLKGVIKQQYTSAVTDYIQNLLNDLKETPRADRSGFLNKILSNLASASLSLNMIGTPIKQSPSFFAASAVIGMGPLMRTIEGKNQRYAISSREIMQYTPLLAIRSTDGGSQELAALKNGQGRIAGWIAKFPGTKLISWVDYHTVKALWAASADYVHGQNKDLDIDSAEFKREVAKVFNECVQDTQPNYTVLQRSEMQRSGNAFYKILGQFKTQPYQNGNIMLDALRCKKANEGTEHEEEANKRFADAFTGQFVGAVAFVILGNLGRLIQNQFRYFRDKDREEITAGAVGKQLWLDFVGSFVGVVPGGSELLDLMQGYDYSNVTTDIVNNVVDSIGTIRNSVEKVSSEESTWEKEGKTIIKSLCRFIDVLGLPASTAMRFYDMVEGWYADAVNLEMDSRRIATSKAVKTFSGDVLDGKADSEKLNEVVARYFRTATSKDPRQSLKNALSQEYKERYIAAGEDERKAIAGMLTGITDADGGNLFDQDDLDRWVKDDIKARDEVQSAIDKASAKVTGIPEDDAKAVNENLKTKVGYAAQANQGYSVKWGSKAEEKLYKDTGGDLNAFARQLAQYGTAMKAADNMGNDNGNISQEELENYLNASSHSKQMKAYIWALRFPDKENPYT